MHKFSLTFFIIFSIIFKIELKAEFIRGTIKADKKCLAENYQLWLIKQNKILFQIEVPLNGSFEFNVLPDEYKIVSGNSLNCLVTKK